MKSNKSLILSLLVFTVIAALYRVIPGRPFGFAPQIAIAFFAGAVIKDKKWAFAIPVISMVLSDLIFQVLYLNGLSTMKGFYDGQLVNYLLFALLVVVGFAIKKINVTNVAIASLTAPTIYFLLSNFAVWASSNPNSGWGRPKTFNGMLLCYADGLPFYKWSIIATFVFSALLFGTYYFMGKKQMTLAKA